MAAPIPIKLVKIEVPQDFQIPTIYTQSAAPAKKALALRLGAEAVAVLQKKAIDTVRKETHEEAIKEATEEFEAQLQGAEEQAAHVATKLRQEKAKAEEALRAAQQRVEALEMTYSEARSQATREAREALTELLAAKDAQIRQLQQTLERQIDLMTTKVDGLQMSLTKTLSSSKEKGQMGEAIVEGILKRAYDCDVQLVSKEAQTADIRMVRKSHKGQHQYFWEVKNYTRMVTTEEVTKFKRDLALHPDIRGGFLVSLRQGIVGHSRGGDIDIEFLEDGRFILYLSNFLSRDDPVFYLQTLRPFLEAVELVTEPVKEEEAAVRTLQAKAELIANLLRSHAATVVKHKNSLSSHKKRMDTMFTEFQGYILEAEAQLGTLLRVAMGADGAAEEAQEESTRALPASVFKKATLADCGDEKARNFIKWLLEATETQEGAHLELKELLERTKGAWGDKYIRGLRDDLFQEAAWPKGSRHIVGLRWAPSATAAATEK